mmetsp:Transcript_33356/g.30324  ORF Transcript_33356/g.30324 Transcript_33356/m.30324 type:complete len:81 (-) Transcript_33356:2253-2495(-)
MDANTFENDVVSIDVMPTGSIEPEFQDTIKTLSEVDLYIDAAFGFLTMINTGINPFSLIYLHGKLMRESFDVLKFANVSM